MRPEAARGCRNGGYFADLDAYALFHQREQGMGRIELNLALSVVGGLLVSIPAAGYSQVTEELDAYWAEASRTVVEGDFEGYSVLYHPDAVLVSQGSETMAIGDALDGWKQLFDDTKEGRATADAAQPRPPLAPLTSHHFV